MEQRVLKEDDLFVVSDELGDIPEARRRLGLYYRDTRHLSVFEIAINGKKPRLMASSCHQNCLCDKQLANRTIELPDGRSALARTISIQRSRFVSAGLHERITLYNYNAFPVPLELSITFGADFLDMLEVRGLERPKHGTAYRPVFSEGRVRFDYEGLDGVLRRTEVVLDDAPHDVDIQEPSTTSLTRPTTFLPESIKVATVTVSHPPTATARWQLTLEPGEPHHLTFHVFATEDHQVEAVADFGQQFPFACRRYDRWTDECTFMETDNELFNQLLQRSTLDIQMLMSPTPEGQIPLAGIPWYACVKGPSACLSGIQTLILNPSIAVDTLRHLAAHQGHRDDPTRDEEPGKIVHEMRLGEMSRAGEIPHSAFYGSVDSTLWFLILFAETMNWLDDNELYQELLPAVKAALNWMEEYGDSDGDGYIEYVSRSQSDSQPDGWKDSRGVVFYPDGTPVNQPVRLMQVQAYAYKAMTETAVLFGRKGEAALADSLLRRATSLKARFNDDFWMDRHHYFAQALDSDHRQVPVVTSKAGHGLYCGMIDEQKAAYVTARLSSTDMACGWGVTTVSRKEPRFNAMSYRWGSVWPADNSIIVAGMKQYGYHWEVEELVTQIFEASQHFDYNRLPELYCGFPRDREAYSVPAQYPVSCSPYAGSAGCALLLFQSMLGLQVDAYARRVYLTPRLPRWLHQATVRGLRVGEGTVNLHFDRKGDVTRFDISENEAGIEVVIPPV